MALLIPRKTKHYIRGLRRLAGINSVFFFRPGSAFYRAKAIHLVGCGRVLEHRSNFPLYIRPILAPALSVPPSGLFACPPVNFLTLFFLDQNLKIVPVSPRHLPVFLLVDGHVAGRVYCSHSSSNATISTSLVCIYIFIFFAL